MFLDLAKAGSLIRDPCGSQLPTVVIKIKDFFLARSMDPVRELGSVDTDTEHISSFVPSTTASPE
jgi:hypothetical protein